MAVEPGPNGNSVYIVDDGSADEPNGFLGEHLQDVGYGLRGLNITRIDRLPGNQAPRLWQVHHT